MLEQTIRTVHSENTVDGIILRFGPLGNKSHHKQLLKSIEDKSKESFSIKRDDEFIKLSDSEIKEYFYNETFLTLEVMNDRGWKLDSFAIIYDNSEMRLQVAIFSRELS